MADRDRDPERSPGKPAAIAKKLYRALTRVEVLAAVTILILCAAFLLDTKGHRGIFYGVALPVFLLHLHAFDWRCVTGSAIAKLALVYLAYFLLSGLWSDAFTWGAFADLLRVGLLLLLFFLMILRLGTQDRHFLDRFAFCFAFAAGASLLAVFAAAAAGLLPFGTRFAGFGIAGQPIIGATLYGFALLLCAFLLLPRTTDWRRRLAWLAAIALCAAFMLLSGSRGPLLALAVALAAGLAVADRRLAFAVAALLVAAIAAGLTTEQQTIRLLFLRGPSGHFMVWQQALAAIAEHPWLGYGSLTEINFDGKHGPVRSPHNLLLASQFYGGLPATLLLLGLLALAAREAWRARHDGTPIYCVLLVFGLAASFFDSRSLVQNLGREWITLWLPIGLLAARESLRRKEAAS